MDQALVFLTSILTRAFVAGTPLLLGTIGEIYTERSGVLNLGIEGMMSVGAVAGFSVTFTTGSPWLGLLAAMGIGGLLAFIHAFVTISLRSNQVVSGLALTMLGLGLSGLWGKGYVGQNLPAKFETFAIPGLSKIPVIGPVLFDRDPLFYISVFICIFLWFILFRTSAGISIRSVGENPKAADSLGIPVYLTRYLCTLVGGIFAGAAGAYLSLAYMPAWIEGMVAGRGWIVISLTILAAWNPLRAFWGAYLFGAIYVLQFLLQPLGISPNVLMMLPYVMTLVILVLGSKESLRKKLNAPESLSEPFIKEER